MQTQQCEPGVIDSAQWVTLRGMGQRLGVSANSARKIARRGLVASLLVPGLNLRKYSLRDIDRLAASSLTPAKGEPEAGGRGQGS